MMPPLPPAHRRRPLTAVARAYVVARVATEDKQRDILKLAVLTYETPTARGQATARSSRLPELPGEHIGADVTCAKDI